MERCRRSSLGPGIGSGELTEVRCAGAVVGLALIAAVTRPSSLRARLGDLALLVALGIALVVGALRHISATSAGITAMLEPVVAIVVPWSGSENPWRRSSCPVLFLPS